MQIEPEIDFVDLQSITDDSFNSTLGISSPNLDDWIDRIFLMLTSIQMAIPGKLQGNNNLLHWVLPIIVGLVLGSLLLKIGWILTLGLILMVPFTILYLSRPFLGVIAWLVLMPFAGILPSTNLIYWLLHRILMSLTLLLVILNYNRRKRPGLYTHLKPPEWAVLFVSGFGVIIILAGQEDIYWPMIHFVDRILVPLFIYLIIRLNPLDQQDHKLLEWTILFIAVSQSIIGISGVIVPGSLPAALKSDFPGYASGTLANPNIFAITMIFCGISIFHSAMSRKPDLIRYLFLLICGLCALGIILSMERAAWLSGALVLLGLLWMYPKMMIRILLACGILVLILFQGGFLSRYIGSASDRLYHQQPVYDRIVVTDAMLQMVQEKPVFGWGYETLNDNITSYYRQVGDANILHGLTTSHNTYLTIMAELGLITFLLYLYPMICLLLRTIREWRWIPGSGLRDSSKLMILWLIAIGYFVISNLLDMRWFPYGVSLWWMTLGLIANIIYPIKSLSSVAIRVRNGNTIPFNDKKPAEM